MSDQFGRYEEDLVDIIKSAKIKLADKIPIADKDERKTLVRQVNKEIDDMNSLISDMEFEISKSGPNSRLTMQNKLKQYKIDVELIQKDLKKTNSTPAANLKSYETFGNSQPDLNDPGRKKILQMNNAVKNAGESIVRSTQIAIETEQIGNSVLGEMYQQGEKLKNTNGRLDDTSVALSKSRRLLNKLSRGVLYNKILLFIIIILELCILGGVIYWKFF